MDDQEFRELTTEQVKRLGVFDGFRFMETPARKEYRKFFESRTRDIAKVTAVIDEAVKFDKLPTIADIRCTWDSLFPPPAPVVDLSPEDQQRHAEFIRERKRQEEIEAAKRRQEFLERRNNPAPRATEAELLEILKIQNSRRVMS